MFDIALKIVGYTVGMAIGLLSIVYEIFKMAAIGSIIAIFLITSGKK